MPLYDDFRKSNYSIPVLSLGGSTRTNTVSTGGGVGNVIKVLSGSDTASFTIWGQRAGSSSLYSETLSVTSTSSGIATATTDWLYCFGAIMDNKYGTARSTQSVDTYFYATSTSGNEVALISSSQKSTKAVAFALSGQNVTVHTITGNNYLMSKIPMSGTTIVDPSSNNAFRFTETMITDERSRDYIFMDSDTGGATVQCRVWEG